MKNKQIYLSWDAYRAGFIATANAIEKLHRQEGILIDEVFYLQNNPLSTKNFEELNAFLHKEPLSYYQTKYSTKPEIIKCWRVGEDLPKIPKIKKTRLQIKGVTHYQSIYNKIRTFIKSTFEHKKNYVLHINVSPGTPQMHVVWLMLNAAGYLPQQTKLWATQEIKGDNLKRKTTLYLVKFKPKTYLSEVLTSNYNSKYKIVVNPNDTKSSKRQEAEELLKLYTAMPQVPILILGERGTGKSTYARTIIFESYVDKNLPFEEIACGTFSEELMRSELFGHEKGAFTGATTEKKGLLSKFEEKGILFLDEIHDLSKSLQRLLIQVLQTGEYYPVGSTKKKKTNPRIIVASNIPYPKLRDEILDADFLDRVARFVVEVPPLRYCKEDLENYWHKIWESLSLFELAPSLIWNQEIKNYLYEAPLYGNFRDLQKLISYLMAFQIREKNTKKAFKLTIAQFEKWQSKPNIINNPSQSRYFKKDTNYRNIINKFNHDLALWAKEYYGGIKEASKILKRKESTLYQDIRDGKNTSS